MTDRLTTLGEDLATVAIGVPSLVAVIALLVGLSLFITHFVERRRDRRKGAKRC
jgi:peptidoglycan/LPS O-acetylase OafA/YrhL